MLKTTSVKDDAAVLSIGLSGPEPRPVLDLICFSHLRWHFVTQRPQHLLTRSARERRVFFWEEPVWENQTSASSWLEVIQEEKTLWVLRPHIIHGLNSESVQRELLRKFIAEMGVRHFVRWYYTPMALGFSEELQADVTVYDCMDELSAFAGAPPQLVAREQELFAAADVVFTGGMSLFEAKRKQHENVHAFPSSIDVQHFARAAKPAAEEPIDQRGIPGPRAGFFGVLDERFDHALMGEVARLRPEMHFVLIGPVVKIDPELLPRASNLHYLGAKSYAELPEYLAGWDVAMMPFARNESTKFISPTKTPEYLAAGKPVVSTPITDVVHGYGDRGLVAIAGDAASFAEALVDALAPPSAKWKASVAATLATSSWDRTWAGMWREVEKARSRSAEVKAPTAIAFVRGGTAAASVKQERYDYIVVGAGFAGSVLAERLASSLKKNVLIIDKREHVAGNAYDFKDAAGILVHRYGPHIFHTNSSEVMEYLSRFTEWRDYEHRVLASVDGKLVPIPINLDTINRLYGSELDAAGMQEFLSARTITPSMIRTSEDIVVSRVGRELYEKFFRNYTRKQWGLDPSELDASVAGRIPVRFDQDDRYFTDTFQAMPRDGYTQMFERMLDHPRITVRVGVNYRDVEKLYPGVRTIFTGPVDEYFDYRFGPLPYRSLEFKHETHACERYQTAPVVNFPNDHAYTRITEFKQLTGQVAPKTSIVYEYPKSEGDPYYPIPRPENAALYARYKELADRATDVHFVGRLATYRYYNMDQVVAQALATFRKIAGTQAALHLPSDSKSAVVAGTR